MKPRILVVDDDAALAEMLTIVLRGEGFEPFVVGDGTQALTAVREIRPDLVLLDLMLPGMNGIDVCRVLRADSGVPIVMLTAKSDTVDVVLGLERVFAGAVETFHRYQYAHSCRVAAFGGQTPQPGGMGRSARQPQIRAIR